MTQVFRVGAIALGAAALLGAVIALACLQFGGAVWLATVGTLFLVAGIFEVDQYVARSKNGPGTWKKTEEAFEDPVSGRPTVVYINEDTGERAYVAVGEEPPA